MATSRSLLVVGAGAIICLALMRSAASIPGKERTYEVEAQVIPEYRTDAARAIDAYERMMERYMDLTERHLLPLGADFQTVGRKLDSIDMRLTELSVRLARIEKALGVGADVNSATGRKADANDAQQLLVGNRK